MSNKAGWNGHENEIIFRTILSICFCFIVYLHFVEIDIKNKVCNQTNNNYPVNNNNCYNNNNNVSNYNPPSKSKIQRNYQFYDKVFKFLKKNLINNNILCQSI